MTNTMSVMDPVEGDLKIIWDPNNADEVAAAKAQFDALTGKGFMAYTVAEGGGKGQQIRQFDARAEKTILAPALRGG
jgi:hypothetical protein